MTGWTWLKREWRGGRSGDLSILIAALTLAVSIVAGIGLFGDRLQQALDQQAATYLAGDLAASSNDRFDDHIIEAALDDGLAASQTIGFATMAYADEDDFDGILVAMKAVSGEYPLRGELTIRDASGVVSLAGPVQRGEVYVAQQYLDRTGALIGDEIFVGELQVKIVAVIDREPDAGFSVFSIGPRVFMNIADVYNTQAIRPGSRVSYSLQFAGSQEQIDGFKAWLEEEVDERVRIRTLSDGQPQLANALNRAKTFLLLCGSLGVALAGVAMALAGRRYSRYLLDAVAVQKTLGATPKRITQLLVSKLIWITLIGTGIGLVFALGIQAAIAYAIKEFLETDLPLPTPLGAWMGLLTAIISIGAFLGPPIYQLRDVPPMRVIRRELGDIGSTTVAMAIGVSAFALLLWVYAGTLWVILGLIAALLIGALVAWLLVKLFLSGKRRLVQASSPWRLAMSSLTRHKWLTAGQVVAFALTLHLIAAAVLVRSSLLEEWQNSIPENAPNHFFTNIAPYQAENVDFSFRYDEIDYSRLYPMVRGRITQVNGEDARERAQRENVRYISRELNLSYAGQQPIDNDVVEGDWWPEDTQENLVSVELDVAQDMGLSIGDTLTFELGGTEVTATVSNFRTLNWDDLRPAFFMILSPPALEDFGASWMTSAYIPETRSDFVPSFLREFPTVTVIDVGYIIRQVQSVIGQVSQAVELVLAFVAISALLVLMATVRSSQDWRMRESAVLRAMGASKKRLLGALLIEFGWLGFIAGILGAAMSEAAVAIIQIKQFDLPFSMHWPLWYTLPFISAALVTLFGWWTSRQVVQVPPNQLLRDAG